MKILLALLFQILCAATAIAGNISFKWDPNTEPDLAGYTVFYSRTPDMASPRKAAETSGTTAVFGNMSAGKPYYFAVAAKNNSGLESPLSNVIFASQPLPPSSLELIINRLVIQ